MNERIKLIAMMAMHIYCAYQPLNNVAYPASAVSEAMDILKAAEEAEEAEESRVETLFKTGGAV